MTMTADRYVAGGYRTVNGWIRPGALRVVLAVDEVQKREGISGAVGEVGVHHGQLYALLHLLRRQGEAGVAVDVFERQELNTDGSGKGDRAAFEANVRRVCGSTEGLRIHQGDSRTLDAAALKDLASGPLRLYSVDGGHTAELARHDTATASGALVDGGVVLVDDYYNSAWPGVVQGIAEMFVLDRPDVVPFFIGHSKLLLTHRDAAPMYQEALERLATRRHWTRVWNHLFGAPVLISERPQIRRRPKTIAKDLLRRSTSSTRP